MTQNIQEITAKRASKTPERLLVPSTSALTQKDPEVGRGVMGEKKGKKITTPLITSHPSGIGLSFGKRQILVWRDREVWTWM